MDLTEFLRTKLWEHADRAIERRRGALLIQIGAGVAEPEVRHEAAVTAFSGAASELLANAKIILWMTRSASDARSAVRAQLEERLKALQSELLEVASSGLRMDDSAAVKRSLTTYIEDFVPDVLDELESAEDPLRARAEEAMKASMVPTAYNPRTKILFLSSEPSRRADGTRPESALNLDVEFREIQRSIRAAVFREQVDLVPRLAVTQRDLLEALNSERPKIVHFAGHGDVRRGIVLENDDGISKPVGGSFLSRIFATLASDIHMVVLNACYSKRQAEAIASSVPVTVGTGSGLPDSAAIAFSGTLYGALANGLTAEQAYEQADAVINDNDPDRRPQVHWKSEASKGMVFIHRPEATTFSILATALNSAADDFFPVDSKLEKLLADAAALNEVVQNKQLSFGEVEIPATLASASGVERLKRKLRGELDKTARFTKALERIERRWSPHLSAEAVSRLAQLEQAIDNHEQKFSDLEGSLGRVLASMLKNAGSSSSGHRLSGEGMISLVGLLSQIRSYIITVRRYAAVSYNQFLEYLPGGLLAKGLVRPVDLPSHKENEVGG